MAFRIKEIDIPSILPKDGFRVPILASFLGIKRFSGFCLGRNSLNPLLVIKDDSMLVRIIFHKKTINYQEIEQIDVLEWFLTKNVRIIPKQGSFTCDLNLLKKENLVKLIRFFNQKQILLSDKAKKLIHL